MFQSAPVNECDETGCLGVVHMTLQDVVQASQP
jgi:hypothetical protein